MSLTRASLALAAAFALAAPAPPVAAVRQEDAPDASVDEAWLLLPDDPLGRLWASVGPETEPAPEPAPAAADRTVWEEWALQLERVRSEDRAVRQAGIRRLVQIARADGRIEDAYAWVVALGAGDAAGLASIVPRMFPGIDPRVPLGPGGRPQGLADGAVLRPCLPPRSSAARPGTIEVRRATARGLRIGDTTFDMLLKVDGSGVVCDLDHVSGGPVKLRLALPAPEGFRLKSAYLDWDQLTLPEGEDAASYDWAGVPLEIDLVPSEDSFTVFARLDRRTQPFPTPPAAGATLPRATRDEGFVLVLREPDEGAVPVNEWKGVAAAWSRALGLPVEVRVVADDAEAARVGGASAPVAIRLDRAPDPIALRRLVTSAIETRLRGQD
ncbi:MAG: hypothetical protein AAF726_02690 [Planctomycetota bacterium]